MRKNFQLLYFLFFLCSACANIKQPTGGPEDKLPPVLEESSPENNSTNFNGKTIVLKFDEYVDAQKLRENIIISPIIEGGYDIIPKKKTVTIKFKEPLRENTTYSINFGESIKDVTKGNFVKNLNLAFSTGPIIDSLSLSGLAYNYITDKGIKDISIQLYKSSDTNTIINSKPLYFSKTNEKGSYTIKNIKEGTYNLYALEDVNKDYMYTKNKESIAFLKNLTITKDTSNIKLGLTKPDKKGSEIISQRQENDFYTITFSKALQEYKISTTFPKVLSELSPEGKKIKIFNNFNSKDTITLYFQLKDSSNLSTTDTARFIFEEAKQKIRKTAYSIKYEKEKLEILRKDTIKFILPKPIASLNSSLLTIKTDTTIQKIKLNDIIIDSSLLSIKYTNTYPFKDSLVILMDKGYSISISNDSSAKIKHKFVYKNPENYGIISGTITYPDSNVIFQLLTEKGKLLDSKPNIKTFYYDFLEPQAYKLRLIIDKNNNGFWDPADIENEIQPEPIHYYKDIIHLRANWELLDLKFIIK